MKSSYLAIAFLILSYACQAQKKLLNGTASLYSYVDKDRAFLSPVVTFFTKEDTSSFWGEIRHNYDDIGVFAYYSGYNFVFHQGDLTCEITPNLGYLVGTFHGLSPALNIFLQRKKVEVFIQSFNPIAFDKSLESYQFMWAEALYASKEDTANLILKVGGSFQWLLSPSEKKFSLGIKAAVKYNDWEFFAYSMDFWRNPYFYIGTTYDFEINKRR